MKSSSTERQFLQEHRKVFNARVIEFLVIRRSMIYMAAVFSILTVGTAVRDVMKQLEVREDLEEKSRMEGEDGDVMRFEEFHYLHYRDKTFKDPEAWLAYTRMLSEAVMAKVLVQVYVVDVIGVCIQCAAAVLCSLMMWKALKKWSRFWVSRQIIRLAWAATMLAPFLITIVPVRSFIDWSVVHHPIEVFTGELVRHFGGESHKAAQEAVTNCKNIIDAEEEGAAEKLTARMKGICSMVGRTPNRHVTCCAFIRFIDVDFRPLHKSCAHIDRYLTASDRPQHEKALNMTAGLCKNYIVPLGQDHLQFGLGHSMNQLRTLEPLVLKAATGLEAAFALQSGVKGLKYILPICLAIAPAMLRGAMKVKVVAPQSTIPGMFVLVLPWLFCPIIWGVYHVFYQLVVDVWLLLGLLLISFFPMWFFVLGKFYRIDQPLTDEKVEAMIKRIGPSVCTTNVIGYVIIGATIVYKAHRARTREGPRTLEDHMWQQVIEEAKLFRWYNLLQFIGNAFAKFTLTTLCGVDWMLTVIGQQRRYETILVIAEKLAQLDDEEMSHMPRKMRSTLSWQEMRDIAAQRQNRLDCVEWILYNEVPIRVEEEELHEEVMLKSRGGSEMETTAVRSRKYIRRMVDIPEDDPVHRGIEMSMAETRSESFGSTFQRKAAEETDGPEGSEASAHQREEDEHTSEIGMLRRQLMRLQSRLWASDPLLEIRRRESKAPKKEMVEEFLGRPPLRPSVGEARSRQVSGTGGSQEASSAEAVWPPPGLGRASLAGDRHSSTAAALSPRGALPGQAGRRPPLCGEWQQAAPPRPYWEAAAQGGGVGSIPQGQYGISSPGPSGPPGWSSPRRPPGPPGPPPNW